MHSILIIIFFLLWKSAPTFQNGCNTADYYWRDFNFGSMPYDAVEIAEDGKYIGQVYIEDRLIPTTIYPHLEALGGISSGHVIKGGIKILCSPNQNKLYWDPVDFDKPLDRQMKNALVGGFNKTNYNIFVGKAYYEGEWKAGHVIPIENVRKGLWIWKGNGDEVKITKFEMLKYNAAVY